MEYFFMFLVGTVITLVIMYIAYQAGSKDKSSNNNSYPQQPTYKKTPVIFTPQYPTVYEAYKKHYPIIKSTVFRAADEIEHLKNFDRSSMEAEIKCFMLFLASMLCEESQEKDSNDFFDCVAQVMTEEEIGYRLGTYSNIWFGSTLPRCDWGKPVSKYAHIHQEIPALRAFVAFGDFLVNPYCSTDYEEAPSLRGDQVFNLFGFDNHFENEIFEKVADYTQCFPKQIRYK